MVGQCLTCLPMISQFYAVRAYPNETCIVKYEFICIWYLVISVRSAKWLCWLVTSINFFFLFSFTSINLPESLPLQVTVAWYRELLQVILLWEESRSWILNFVYLIGRKRTSSVETFSNTEANVCYGLGVISEWRPIIILNLFPGKSQFRELL